MFSYPLGSLNVSMTDISRMRTCECLRCNLVHHCISYFPDLTGISLKFRSLRMFFFHQAIVAKTERMKPEQVSRSGNTLSFPFCFHRRYLSHKIEFEPRALSNRKRVISHTSSEIDAGEKNRSGKKSCSTIQFRSRLSPLT